MEHFGVCELSVLPVRKNPHSTNELVTQILYGEIFTIIEKIQPDIIHLEEIPEYFMDDDIAR